MGFSLVRLGSIYGLVSRTQSHAVEEARCPGPVATHSLILAHPSLRMGASSLMPRGPVVQLLGGGVGYHPRCPRLALPQPQPLQSHPGPAHSSPSVLAPFILSAMVFQSL